jgi:hypothetical protein
MKTLIVTKNLGKNPRHALKADFRHGNLHFRIAAVVD